MVFPARIAGQDWVFVAPQDGNGVLVLRMDGPPEDRTLTYVTRTLPMQSDVFGAHDIYVQFDEPLDAWVLYSADAFTGWKAFDVSDPALPLPLAVVPNHEGVSGTHSVQAAWLGGRRIVATSTEAPLNGLKVFDATDLAAPVPIAYWTLEANERILESQHNLNIVEGRLYLAHYGNGLYVFDLAQLPSGPGPLALLQPEAHYASSQESIVPTGSTSIGFWDVLVHHGFLYAGNHAGEFEPGLHTIAFGCIPPGDPLYTSTG